MKQGIIRTLGFVLFCVVAPTWACLTVTIDYNSDTIRLSYDSEQPITRLIFNSTPSIFRQKHWKLLTPELKYALWYERAKEEQSEPREVVVGQQQQSFKHVSFELKREYFEFEKHYPVLIPNLDGSILLFTGHLFADVEINGEYNYRDNKFVVNAFGNNVFSGGRAFQDRRLWLGERTTYGQYIYFGKERPTQNQYYRMLIDQKSPVWVGEQLEHYLSQILGFYTKYFGDLEQKPSVFTSYLKNFEPDDGDDEKFDVAGGAVGSSIQLSLIGDWDKQTDEHIEELVGLVAHEFAHLWHFNGSHDRRDAWIKEGGADAFEERVLVKLGIYDASEQLERDSEFLNDCIEELDEARQKNNGAKVPLKDAYRYDHGAYYDCGVVIAMMTELGVKKAGYKGEAPYFYFWQKLLTKNELMRFGPEDYYSVLTGLSQDPELVKSIKQLVEEGLESPSDFFMKVFSQHFDKKVVAKEDGTLAFVK